MHRSDACQGYASRTSHTPLSIPRARNCHTGPGRSEDERHGRQPSANARTSTTASTIQSAAVGFRPPSTSPIVAVDNRARLAGRENVADRPRQFTGDGEPCLEPQSLMPSPPSSRDWSPEGMYLRFRHTVGSIRIDLLDGETTEHWYLSLNKGVVTISHKTSRADAVMRTDKKLFEGMAKGTVNALPPSSAACSGWRAT